MTHKGRVSTFQTQFAEQKLQIKTMVTKQITVLKTQLVQANKMKEQIQNDVIIQKQHKKDAKLFLSKKQAKNKLIARDVNIVKKEINEIACDIQEVSQFKQCLISELKNE